ncbi:transketolase [Sneathiella chungangensis]|uniref:Transketolase n=1 Tax=Sneathiella chungangensis TaxID=1418234 RepID=A0A845MF95_9PROT|nr:transketolase [Sneathiella chungangensis]MZR22090.1 transketolase [Sneathiella chungangensis]
MNKIGLKSSPNSAKHDDMANAIRALSMDAVQAANSGHPGMPMGMADVATVLFSKFLKFDPAKPDWPDRDRFVLSAGHGSMLLYSLLYLTGYKDMTLEEIKNFRQLGSKTAGHPEYGHAKGIETTTGPLGQGLAMAVGMALAERLQAARYKEITDHYTYVIAGDGCLMEGISHEAISFAGHLKLNKLIVLWDDNSISIDGSTDLAVSDDQAKRFEAHGWDVQAVDGHDATEIEKAIAAAKETDRPSLIACRTTIGFGAPNKQGTSGVHGAPLGEEEVALARKELGWPHTPFDIPVEILDKWRAVGTKGARLSAAWEDSFKALPEEQRTMFNADINGNLPSALDDAMLDFKRQLVDDAPAWATRKSSQEALKVINEKVTTTIGGSADLTGSNLTKTPQTEPVTAEDFSGRYIYYGVREFGMAAIMNGMALHKGFIPYGGTFMVFTDYARPAIRLSALMEQRVVYVMTHDSIGLGEDGPTHQPVEHLAALRAMPNLNVFRPADAVETSECWHLALQSKKTPSVLSLSRQNLELVRKTHTADNLCARGAYELAPANLEAKVTILATGSEVAIALAAQKLLESDGVGTRVVSVPSWELFEKQDDAYKKETLREDTVRIAVEAGCSMGWEKFTGPNGGFIGINSFGASAPAGDLYKHFGITAEAVAAAAKDRL